MSLTVTGTVVDENDKPLPGLLVEARGDWLLTSAVIDSTRTGPAGGFTLVLPGMVGQPDHPSSCTVRVIGDLGRPISEAHEVPGTDGDRALGRITVRNVERTGFLVGDALGVLTGRTIDGQLFEGSDAVVIKRPGN